MSNPRFVHLRVHSDFSIVDGLASPQKLIRAAAEKKMVALALTDYNHLCGFVKFYCAALSAGIKPIIGLDCRLTTDPALRAITDRPVTLLAANNSGYKNLTRLISQAYQAGHDGSGPVIPRQALAEYNEGLIVLSGGMDGELGQQLVNDEAPNLSITVNFYQRYFPDRYYIEIESLDRPGEKAYVERAIRCAETYALPLVATNLVCFLHPEEFEVHEIRTAIHAGLSLTDPKRPKRYVVQNHLVSEEEMEARFADLPDALQNTIEIAKRCNVTLQLDQPCLPQFPTGNMSTEAFLVQQAEEGLEKRLKQRFPDPEKRALTRPHYVQRLSRELSVINTMGFPGYFLIVMEFIRWSKAAGIPVGPGRGSGAGSLVAYALEITNLDPLEFGLLFERFLNPDRISLPDFDIDFCMDQRDAVIEHVAEKYGRNAVSQIITFGTLGAKAAIRDVGRVLGHNYGFVDRIAKLVPLEIGITLSEALRAEPMLQALYEEDEEVQAIVDKAQALEGVIRNVGKHAGGVVIASTELTDFSAIYCDAEGKHPVTHFDKDDVERVGLVKFDFLGLRTLTIIDSALKLINRRRHAEQKPPLAIDQIPLHDPLTFHQLQLAETTAIFQLESRGMRDLIRRLKPDCFEELIALVALFRPGPLQSGMVDNFINRKFQREPVAYPDPQYQHPLLKPILQPTYGIILYQEQVMQIAQTLAGYSLAEADLLRRVMGKKKPEEMAKQRDFFEHGAKNNGIDGNLAMKIFDLVEHFAGYGFNKSHSAAYALLSYQTLWLKAHFPSEFMAAALSADMDNTDKVLILLDACKQLQLSLLPPDIQKSQYEFTVDAVGKIRYGLGAIKGVGKTAAQAVIAAREALKPNSSFFDFCAALDLRRVNRRVLEKLVKAGACESFGAHRAAHLAAITQALQFASQQGSAQSSGQEDLFGACLRETSEATSLPNQLPWSQKQLLLYEREALGLCLTGHPITAYLEELSVYTLGRRLSYFLSTKSSQQSVTVAGWVTSIRHAITKQRNRLKIVVLDDNTAQIDVVIFDSILPECEAWLKKEEIIIVTGQVSWDKVSGRPRMVAQTVHSLTQKREKHATSLTLGLHANQLTSQRIDQLHDILHPFSSGRLPLRFYYIRPECAVSLPAAANWRITPEESLLEALQGFLGPEWVMLEFATSPPQG